MRIRGTMTMARMVCESEEREIDGANPALALEGDVADAVVVDEIGNEEGAGDGEGGEHQFFVEFAFAGADGGVAGGEENGAGAVERGVKGGLGEHGEWQL